MIALYLRPFHWAADFQDRLDLEAFGPCAPQLSCCRLLSRVAYAGDDTNAPQMMSDALPLDRNLCFCCTRLSNIPHALTS